MKKILALMLALMLTAGALAEASPMATLFDAAVELACDTGNVTLSGEAAFSWDGKLFKTMRAEYRQDGFRSYLSYMLDTPKPDGSIYRGGYEVLGLDDGTVYASETWLGNYYYEMRQTPSDTILTADNQLRAMLSVAKLLAVSCEPLASCTVKNEGGSTVYTFTAGDLPDYADSMAWYLVGDYLFEKYYCSIFSSPADEEYVDVWYENFEAVIADIYRQLWNAEMPVTYEFETDEEWDRYAAAYNYAEQAEAAIRGRYQGGHVYVLTDGTEKWYADEAEMRRDNGIIIVDYKDDYRAALDYYRIKTGEELSVEDMRYVVYSLNPELTDALEELRAEAEEYYCSVARDKNPDCVRCTVNADGTVTTYDTVETVEYISVKQEIMGETVFAALSSLNADVVTDDSGRLTGFTGSVTIDCTDGEGSVHKLDIDFAFEAKDYGSTAVNSVFRPADYGWVSVDEYQASIEESETDEDDGSNLLYIKDWDSFISNAPKTISFMGRTYETMMEYYD